MIDANYIALSILNQVMRAAIKEAEKGIENAGALDAKDTKLNDSAKSYFKDQTERYKEAVNILRGISKEFNDRLWKTQ